MFRLLSIKILKHPFLSNKTFNISNPEETQALNYYSIVIGPNGTGKSNLLGFIIEIFNELALLKNDHNYKIKKIFLLHYSLNGSEYKIHINAAIQIFLKNNNIVIFDKIDIPTCWLACSSTINDKYPILNNIRKPQIPQYKYLGIRSASNNAFISRITTSTVMYLIQALKRGKSMTLSNIYMALGLNSEVEIIFTAGPMLKNRSRSGYYIPPDNEDELVAPHMKFLYSNITKTNYRAEQYHRAINNKKQTSKALAFLQNNHNTFYKNTKVGIQFRYRINLKNDTDVNRLLYDWDAIAHLLDLEVLKISKYIVTKETSFKYEETSSGESHLLTSLHGIVSNIEDNSILIIDEPEISLHPNWQIDYITILKQLLNSYSGINAIISTHSPFLLSSLHNEESRVVSLNRDEKSHIQVKELDYETYGWEPERILYKVFNIVTTRNKLFEFDLRKLIDLISKKSNDYKSITLLTNKLEKFITEDNDPLQLLINQAHHYLETRNAV